MAILFSNEIINAVIDELKNAESSVQIITAYCKKNTFEKLDSVISSSVNNRRLLVRFRLDDVLKGSTDFEILEYGLQHGWDVFLRFDLHAKTISRDKGYMTYVKEAEKIGDFLRLVSANNAILYYEDIRIYRDHKNMTNRLNNMEQANVDKSINASREQLEDINLIKEKIGLDAVDDRIKVAIEYREKYPEVSLSELSEIISLELDKKITKSGLSHRFRKIREIADKLRKND